MCSGALSISGRSDTVLRFPGLKMPPPTPPNRGGFQETLPERVKAIKEANPGAKVQLWAEDEARLGLKAVIRRVWAPVGQRPTARVKGGYEWT